MTATTLYLGNNIANSATDVLQAITEAQLHQYIANASANTVETQQQLLRMLTVDAKAASNIKKRLPYFIGATFKNNLRHVANFVQIDYFILDFDHLPFDAKAIENLKQKIAGDDNLLLAFISPSGKGLKCVFKLNTPATHTAQFSAFYKSFAFDFSTKYQLSDFVDYSTCDVTRVCFIAADKKVVYNPGAIPVNYTTAAANPVELFESQNESEFEKPETKPTKPELNDNVYKQLVKRLDPQSYSVPKQKQIYVPAELHLIHHLVEDALLQHNFRIKETREINYGKKYVIINNLDLAELNIYYGKGGYQVVKSPKSGTNADFNEACFQLINRALFQSSAYSGGINIKNTGIALKPDDENHKTD